MNKTQLEGWAKMLIIAGAVMFGVAMVIGK